MRPLLFIIALAGITVPFFHTTEKRMLNSREAHAYMMTQLHLGNYDSIPTVISKVSEVLARHPQDAQMNADLGFLYLWSFSERGRNPGGKALERNIYLSNHYFKEAIKYNPGDPRLKGFQAAVEVCEGALSKNIADIYTGYINSFHAIREWPQFNKFAFSLVSSQFNKNSPLFLLALKYQWELLDDCSCKELDMKTVKADVPGVFHALIEELSRLPEGQTRRACWNSAIAPHNYEGFLLNFGDMLVKAGEIDDARKIYAAARMSPSFRQWPYRHVLENRIRHAEFNSTLFDKHPALSIDPGEEQIFINSPFSCTGCHQQSKKEFSKSAF
jgi:hypothetical protein